MMQELIHELSQNFGNQCVVVAIDAKRIDDNWKIHLAETTIEEFKEVYATNVFGVAGS